MDHLDLPWTSVALGGREFLMSGVGVPEAVGATLEAPSLTLSSSLPLFRDSLVVELSAHILAFV
jgi:hypothetical protein